jgi:mannan endo-1,4-beta-mannosidase
MKSNTAIFILILAIQQYAVFSQNKMKLIDRHATAETKNLYFNLIKLAKDHILFGHQHATEYGHGWREEENRSDVKSVTGSHPAIIGVDFSGLSGRPDSIIEKVKTVLRKNIADTYDRGGVTTVSWHFPNPVTPTDFYWKDSVSAPAVKMIIPGGSHHEKYKQILQTIANFAKSVQALP